MLGKAPISTRLMQSLQKWFLINFNAEITKIPECIEKIPRLMACGEH